MKDINFAKDATILCMLGRDLNPEFTQGIEEIASSLGCRIVWGRAETPDLRALPCSMIIVDRSFAGRYEWEQYLKLRNKAKWNNCCLVIDNRRDYANIQDDNIKTIDVANSGYLDRIRAEISAMLENRNNTRTMISDLTALFNRKLVK